MRLTRIFEHRTRQPVIGPEIPGPAVVESNCLMIEIPGTEARFARTPEAAVTEIQRARQITERGRRIPGIFKTPQRREAESWASGWIKAYRQAAEEQIRGQERLAEGLPEMAVRRQAYLADGDIEGLTRSRELDAWSASVIRGAQAVINAAEAEAEAEAGV